MRRETEPSPSHCSSGAGWDAAFSAAVEASIVLQVQGLDGCWYESNRLGSTFRIFHRMLQYLERLDSNLCSIHMEGQVTSGQGRSGLHAGGGTYFTARAAKEYAHNCCLHAAKSRW